MLAAVALLTVAFRPIAFGEAPIRSQVLIGESIQRKRRGIERTLLEDRVVIGKWFDGTRVKEAEEAIWLTPELVSRWLGYLQSREGWSDDELQRRWLLARTRLNGKLTFIVRLTAFPKKDPLEEDETAPAGTADLEDVRGVISYDGSQVDTRDHAQTQSALLAQIVGHGSDDVFRVAWSDQPPLNDIFEGALATAHNEPIDPNLDFQIGDYFGAIWLEQCDIPDDLAGHQAFDLQIVTLHKERVARFSLVYPKPPRQKVFRLKF